MHELVSRSAPRCGNGPKGPTWQLAPGALAPLAQLAQLEELYLTDELLELPGGLPREWGAVGAFPRLRM